MPAKSPAATSNTAKPAPTARARCPATPALPRPPYSAATTSVSAEASGLEYATTYHFHLVAENSNGENASYDDTFTTLPLPPAIESLTGQAFAETALLHATINPGGGPTTFRVEYVDQHTFETENGFEHAQSTAELDAVRPAPPSSSSPTSTTSPRHHLPLPARRDQSLSPAGGR